MFVIRERLYAHPVLSCLILRHDEFCRFLPIFLNFHRHYCVIYDIIHVAYTIFAIFISLKLITPEASVNYLGLKNAFRNKYFCTIQSKKLHMEFCLLAVNN